MRENTKTDDDLILAYIMLMLDSKRDLEDTKRVEQEMKRRGLALYTKTEIKKAYKVKANNLSIDYTNKRVFEVLSAVLCELYPGNKCSEKKCNYHTRRMGKPCMRCENTSEHLRDIEILHKNTKELVKIPRDKRAVIKLEYTPEMKDFDERLWSSKDEVVIKDTPFEVIALKLYQEVITAAKKKGFKGVLKVTREPYGTEVKIYRSVEEYRDRATRGFTTNVTSCKELLGFIEELSKVHLRNLDPTNEELEHLF